MATDNLKWSDLDPEAISPIVCRHLCLFRGLGYGLDYKYDPRMETILRAIPGAEWDKDRGWWIPASARAELVELMPTISALVESRPEKISDPLVIFSSYYRDRVVGYGLTCGHDPEIWSIVRTIPGACCTRLHGWWIPPGERDALIAVLPKIKSILAASEAEWKARRAAQADFESHRTIVSAATSREFPPGSICKIDDAAVAIQRYGRIWSDDGVDVCYAYWRESPPGSEVSDTPVLPVVWPTHLPHFNFRDRAGTPAPVGTVFVKNDTTYTVTAVRHLSYQYRVWYRPSTPDEIAMAVADRLAGAA